GPTTDGNGFAVLPVGRDRVGAAVEVADGGNSLTVELRATSSENRLFPHFSAESPLAGLADRRAVVITDRGIYRPGAKVHIKASVRRRIGEELVPFANKPVVVTVMGPTEEELASFQRVTDDMGSVAADFDVPAEARLGRHIIRVLEAGVPGTLDDTVIQVAEFEPPRFTVDVDASEARGVLSATVLGKYLFGASMDGASVEWTVTRAAAKMPAGKLTDAGLRFTQYERAWWDDDRGDAWSRAGSGKLAADGTLKVTQKLDLGGVVGPQAFTIEADVADTSYRHIASRGTVVVHPAPRYAGIKLARPWSD